MSTPTPWTVGDCDGGSYPIWAKLGPLNVQPATAHGGPEARLIVKAVNNHDTLVKALEEIANGGNAVFRQWETTGPKTREEMAYIAREALLSLVGGER